jgi:hypothetical protein
MVVLILWLLFSSRRDHVKVYIEHIFEQVQRKVLADRQQAKLVNRLLEIVKQRRVQLARDRMDRVAARWFSRNSLAESLNIAQSNVR